MFETKKMQVAYTAGTGGAHNEAGLYRKNPVTGDEKFSVWSGLGTAPDGYTREETVCAVCGRQFDADMDNADICSYCGATA